MIKPRLLISLIVTFFLNVGVTLAQERLAMARPGSLSLFRPFNNTDSEGLLTNIPLRFSISGSVGYDDNVFSSKADRKGSVYDGLALGIGSHVGNQRTRLDADLSLGMIYYWDRPGPAVDPNISFNLNFTHEFTPRLVLGVTSYMAYQRQPDYSLGIGQLQSEGNYFYTSETISLGYEWTRRFTTVTSYTLNSYLYHENVAAAGENRLEHLISQALRYQLYPTVTSVLEYRFGSIQYETANNDSYTHYFLAGGDFTLNPKLTFTLRGGIEIRQDLGVLKSEKTNPYFESTFAYEYQPSSFLRWYNRYGQEESDFGVGFGSQTTYRTSVQLDHSFGSKLKAGLGVSYSNEQYGAPISSTENAISASTSLSYAITRAFSLQTGYSYTHLFSELPGREYYRNQVYLGASFAF